MLKPRIEEVISLCSSDEEDDRVRFGLAELFQIYKSSNSKSNYLKLLRRKLNDERFKTKFNGLFMQQRRQIILERDIVIENFWAIHNDGDFNKCFDYFKLLTSEFCQLSLDHKVQEIYRRSFYEGDDPVTYFKYLIERESNCSNFHHKFNIMLAKHYALWMMYTERIKLDPVFDPYFVELYCFRKLIKLAV